MPTKASYPTVYVLQQLEDGEPRNRGDLSLVKTTKESIDLPFWNNQIGIHTGAPLGMILWRVRASSLASWQVTLLPMRLGTPFLTRAVNQQSTGWGCPAGEGEWWSHSAQRITLQRFEPTHDFGRRGRGARRKATGLNGVSE